MQDKKTELIDKLLGFDSRELQRKMTEGLEEWCNQRREALRTRKLCTAATCVMLLTVLCSYYLAPTASYRIDERQSYEGVVTLVGKMLER